MSEGHGLDIKPIPAASFWAVDFSLATTVIVTKYSSLFGSLLYFLRVPQDNGESHQSR